MDMKRYLLLIMVLWFIAFDSYKTPNIGAGIEFPINGVVFKPVKLKEKIKVGSLIKLEKDKKNEAYLSLKCANGDINTDFLASEKLNDTITIYHIDYGVCIVKNEGENNLYITLSGGMDFLFLKNLKYCTNALCDIGINEIFKGDNCEVYSTKGIISIYKLKDSDYEQLRLYGLTYGGVLN